MAGKDDNWVTKAEIRKATGMKSYTLNNAIAALKKRHVILPKPGKAGVYRLPTKAFAAWIGAYAKTED